MISKYSCLEGTSMVSALFFRSLMFLVAAVTVNTFVFVEVANASSDSCATGMSVPAHQYSFENSADGSVFDSVGSADGQISKAVIGAGKWGSGVFFANNLTDARVQLNPFSLDLSRGLTLSFWVKPLNFSSVEARYISKALGTSDFDHDLMVSSYSGSKLRFRLRINDKTETLITGSSVLVANSWNHVAATFNLATMRIYLNGNIVAEQNRPGVIYLRDAAAIAFGNQPANAGERPLWGTLDEISIFERSLGQQEIAALGTLGFACEPPDEPTPPDPAVTDPVVTEPVVTEPVVTEPVVTDPVVTDPVVRDPVVIDPAQMFQGAQLVHKGSTTTVAQGDIDGDGDIDLFAAEGGKHSCGSACRLLAWFEAPNWRRHNLGDLLGPFTGDSVLVDLDKDGDLDVAVSVDNHSSDSSTDAVYWYENRVNKNQTWVKHTIEYNVPNAFHIGEMDSADVDGDGKMDIVVRHLGTYRFVVYFQNSTDSWTPLRLNTRPREGLKLADLDGNKRVDIIGNGFILFAPVNPRTQPWTEKTIDAAYYKLPISGLNNSTKANVADLNGDGRLDVVMSSAEGGAVFLAWYKNPSDAKAGSWSKHFIENPQANNHQVQIADIDLDGDLDIVGGFAFGDPGIYWWKNVNSVATTWERHTINGSKGCYNCKVADFDGDGDFDVAGPTEYTGALYFYRNLLVETGGGSM
jgi:hypothetical protein